MLLHLSPVSLRRIFRFPYISDSILRLCFSLTIVPCDYTLITFTNFTANLIEREFIELPTKHGVIEHDCG